MTGVQDVCSSDLNCQFQGFDIDLSVIECAKKNTHILDSGAEESIHFKQMELKKTIEYVTYSQTKRIVLLSNVLISLSSSLSHPTDTNPRVRMLHLYHCIMIWSSGLGLFNRRIGLLQQAFWFHHSFMITISLQPFVLLWEIAFQFLIMVFMSI